MKKPDSRQFSIGAVLSVSSGRMLCDFSEMHECIEYLVGTSVWTHQLADRKFVDELKAAVIRQHSALVEFDADVVTTENWQDIVKAATKKFGATLALHPMGEPEHYEGAFTRPLKGKKVVVVSR